MTFSIGSVVSLVDGHRVSSWDFSSPLDDEEGVSAEITCVAEFHFNAGDDAGSTTTTTTKLLVGVDKGVDGGLLCLFEPRRSKLEKSISVRYA